MEIEHLKHFTREMIKHHKKIIKPWKVNEDTKEGRTNDWAQGWNDCLKEIEKNHKRFMKFMEEKHLSNTPKNPRV